MFDAMDGDTCGHQIMFYRACLLREPRFRYFSKLTNEYAVDMLTRNLETRLNYIRANQQRLRQADAELMGEDFVPDSQNIYLPASFMGSRRWASEQVADSLTIAANCGKPTFFITMTCNSEWPEISSRLRAGQNFSDIPSDVVRVFKQKLCFLEQALKSMFPNAGRIRYLIHCVEFQKRGLPHAHIVCKYDHDCVHPDDIDRVISAEMPTEPLARELVRKLMVHHHPPPTILLRAIVRELWMAPESVALVIRSHCRTTQLLILKEEWFTVAENQGMNGWFRIVFPSCKNFTVTLILKQQAPLTFSSTFSSIFTSASPLLPFAASCQLIVVPITRP
jgi:hypothetical protein